MHARIEREDQRGSDEESPAESAKRLAIAPEEEKPQPRQPDWRRRGKHHENFLNPRWPGYPEIGSLRRFRPPSR